jgi:hypothetical protein
MNCAVNVRAKVEIRKPSRRGQRQNGLHLYANIYRIGESAKLKSKPFHGHTWGIVAHNICKVTSKYTNRSELVRRILAKYSDESLRIKTKRVHLCI